MRGGGAAGEVGFDVEAEGGSLVCGPLKRSEVVDGSVKVWICGAMAPEVVDGFGEDAALDQESGRGGRGELDNCEGRLSR